MKNFFNMLFVGMVWLWASISGSAQPATGDSVSGASSVTVASNPAKKLASNGGGFVGGVVLAEVVPILGTPLNPGNGWIKHVVIEGDWLANIKEWVPVIDGPVSWKNLTFAQSGSVATSQWPVVQQLVHLRSIDGSDSINIGMFSMNSVETPTGSLTDVYTVGNKSYSPAAIGIKADGSRVTGGDNNQMVAEIVFVVQMRLFSGGSTQAGLQEVRDWVLRQPEYKVTYKVTMEGREVRGGEASVTVQKPYLTITPQFVSLQGDEPESEYPYDLQYAEVATGPWRVLTTVYSGDKIPISTTSPAKFFRAIPKR